MISQSLVADKYYVKPDDTFECKKCKIFDEILHCNFKYFMFVTIILNPFYISGFVFMWNRSLGNGFTEKCTERLPSIFQVPNKQIFVGNNTFHIQIVLFLRMRKVIFEDVINLLIASCKRISNDMLHVTCVMETRTSFVFYFWTQSELAAIKNSD